MTTEYLHGVRVIEINEGVRPIRTISTAIIGIVGTAPGALGQATASLALGDELADTAITITAKAAGSGGNRVSLHLRDPRTASAALQISVATAGQQSTITAALATDADGDLTTTAAALKAAVEALPAAHALVSINHAGSSDGTGILASTTKPLPLAGGRDEAFPVDTPRLLTSAASAAGLGTTGTLPAAVDRIRSQTRAPIVVVRVAAGADDAETTTNIIGDASDKTGLYAFLRAEAETGLKPRILGIPEYDTQPVIAALIPVADSLRSMIYCAVHGATDLSDAIDYRKNFGSRRVLLIWPQWSAWDSTTSSIQPVEPVAWALGLRAKIDYDTGWHKVLSNVDLNGPSGISIGVQFDPHDPAAESNLLNAEEVTTLVRMEGFRYWGCRTTAFDPLFAFESATRTADVLAESIQAAHLWAIDKPMHPTLVRDILESVNAKGRELVRGGYLLGFNAWLDPEANTPDILKDGRLFIDYDYTPVPPLEQLNFRQRITDRYLVEFAEAVSLA